MRTKGTLFFRQAMSATLTLCLTTSSVLAQKGGATTPKASSAPTTATAPKTSVAPTAPAPATAPTTDATSAPKPLTEVLTGQAKVDYQAARLLYEDGDFAGASLKFKQAFDASKDPRLLWNMAACEKSLRHYGKVFKLVERYLFLGGSSLSESDKSDATSLLEAMKSFVGHVRISVNESEATIAVDDEVIGSSPLMEPVLIDQGSRRLRVTKTGFTEFSDTLQIQGSSELPVTVKLVKEDRDGRVTVTAGADNYVYLDGKLVGQGRWEGPLPSGMHHVRVTGQGLKTYQTDVTLGEKETRTLQVTLEPEAKKESSTTLFWVLGGVVVAGVAAGGTAYLISRNKDSNTTTPAPVLGTIQPGSVQLFFHPRFQ